MRDVRIGAAERAQVLDRLSAALDAGLLPVAEYDTRVAAVGTATYAAELRDQLAGLPAAYAWHAPAPPPPSGRLPLVLGVASVPLSCCVVGGVLGVLAVLTSRGGGPRPGGPRMTPALIGRICGIVGIVLSIGAAIALVAALRAPAG